MCEKFSITIVVENSAHHNFISEHGLALYIDTPNFKLLFDTGAGDALLHNIKNLDISLDNIDGIAISHGHCDHTGALPLLPKKTLWAAPNLTTPRCSRHPDRDIHHIGSPLNRDELTKRFNLIEINGFTEISKDIFLTGAIPRVSTEDSGGPFFFDDEGKYPDSIADEQSLLTASGVLISGCCHAGIINTIKWCKSQKPEIKIHTIVGGLHLAKASLERLEMSVNYLRDYKIDRLYLMHCTGENAINYLRKNLPHCQIFTPIAGDIIA